MDKIIAVLQDPFWQGISGIASLLTIAITLWLAKVPDSGNPLQSRNTALFFRILAIILPCYSIFVLSILVVNMFTSNPNQLLYGSVGMATLLGVAWGIIWKGYF